MKVNICGENGQSIEADICQPPWGDNEKCGGCLQCRLEQSHYVEGKQAERANKAEVELKKAKIVGSDICAKHVGNLIHECPYCKIEELTTKCIQKNSEYQMAINMAKTYKEALEIKNPLNQNESFALYWMNRGIDVVQTMNKCEKSINLLISWCDKLEEYNQLLVDELNDSVGIAASHGWKSTRVETGQKMRDEIKEIDDKITELL